MRETVRVMVYAFVRETVCAAGYAFLYNTVRVAGYRVMCETVRVMVFPGADVPDTWPARQRPPEIPLKFAPPVPDSPDG